jgi:hypothetical protein
MITCHISNLEARCNERGYTLDEVRPCIVSQDGDSIVVDETHSSYPRPRVVLPAEPLPPRDSDTVGWLEKAKNFAVASAKHVAAGMPTCSDEEIIRRHDICMGCEFFKDNSCGKCGCPISRDKKFISKLAWADQSCPVGKWGPIPKEG